MCLCVRLYPCYFHSSSHNASSTSACVRRRQTLPQALISELILKTWRGVRLPQCPSARHRSAELPPVLNVLVQITPHEVVPSTEMSWMAKRRMMVQIIPRVILAFPSTISAQHTHKKKSPQSVTAFFWFPPESLWSIHFVYHCCFLQSYICSFI